MAHVHACIFQMARDHGKWCRFGASRAYMHAVREVRAAAASVAAAESDGELSACDNEVRQPKQPPTGPQHRSAAAVVHSSSETAPPPPRGLSATAGMLMRGPTAAMSSGGWSPGQSVQGAREEVGEAGMGPAAEQSGASARSAGLAVRKSLKGLELFGEAVVGPDTVPPAAMVGARRSWPSMGRGEDIAAAARDGVTSLVRAARDGLQGGFRRGSVSGGCLAEAAAGEGPTDGNALRIVQLRSHRGDQQARDGDKAPADGARRSFVCGGAAAEARAVANEDDRSDASHGIGHETKVQEMSAADEWLADSCVGGSRGDCLAVNGRGNAAKDCRSGAAPPVGGRASPVRRAAAAVSLLFNPALCQFALAVQRMVL